jgi:hypothetical protein
MKSSNSYQTHKNLPFAAGICSVAEAQKPGLSIGDCVSRLKRYHYVFKRLHQIFVARLTAEPIYELKMAFSLHAHYCSEHVSVLRKRVGEMREPPLGLDAVPDVHLEILLDEILCSPTTEELLSGLYDVVLPALSEALKRHLQETNPIADHPSLRVCRFALIEVEEMVGWGNKALAAFLDSTQRKTIKSWLNGLRNCLDAAGSLDGSQPVTSAESSRFYSLKPFVYDGVPRRDERFPDPYNMGVQAEVFLYEPNYPLNAKTLMMFFKRLREIDVPEMMASIITETSGKPWDYYQDMTRQLWDEARHAMMGEIGFISLGLDWRKAMVNFTWSLGLNTQLKPLERHGVLYFIEQGLMPKTGKRYEWEVGVASNNPMSALFQDYDWADEVLHARIGRDWYVTEFAGSKEANQYGDACWSKVMIDFDTWRKQGLTEHRNWWPDLYQDACKQWQIEPDASVLAYHETYQGKRPDLKTIEHTAGFSG